MKLGDSVDTILQFIDYAKINPTYELEVLFKNISNNKISSEQFNNVMKRLKGIFKTTTTSENLDIFYQYAKDKQSNIRVTINGIESIRKYCKTNNLKNISNVSFLKKGQISVGGNKLRPINNNNYNLRFNIKEEDIVRNESDISNVMLDWNKKLKTFRYKKRYSFKSPDNLFQFDLTIVKSSNIRVSYLDSKTMKKKNVPEYMKKFILLPSHISDLNSYWDSLTGESNVKLKGKRIENYVYSKTLQESNTLTNPVEYEIELEYIGNKINYTGDNQNILNKLVSNIGIVLQAIQKSYYIISEEEKNMVRTEYKELMGGIKFKAPMNVTLELKHMVEKKYEDYKDVLSIRKNYSVTDKADGERNLLFVASNDEVFLMNRESNIKKLNAKLTGLSNTILDGEYILKDKNGNNINLFMVFDIYFLNGDDLRGRILNRTKDQIETNTILKSRNEIMNDLFDNLPLVKDDSNNLVVNKKKFYYGNIENFQQSVDEDISKLNADLSLVEKNGEKYKQIQAKITELKEDTKIFEESNTVYQKQYIYHIDGLIFTPLFLAVGEQPGKSTKFEGRWNVCFKWKPPEENTIDFFVRIKTEDNSDSHLISYKNENNSIISYKSLILNVGYDPRIHTKHNSCKVLNEGLMFDEKYYFVPFTPTNPFKKDSNLCNIPLDKYGAMKCLDKNIITNNSIVEFSYDESRPEGFKWIPLRVRNSNKPNDFITAKNVWNTIHNPVTTDMILTGKTNIDEVFDEVYYSKNVDSFNSRKKSKTKSLQDFHSYVKKTLIMSSSKENDTLLDISCGRGGDYNHWIEAKLGKVVGIDVNRENLENIDSGACNRILDNYNKNPLMDNILFIWGNSIRDFTNGDAGKDDLNKYYLDIIYGNASLEKIPNEKLRKFYKLVSEEEDIGFDVVSCQFSFHYFFKNQIDLRSVLRNVSRSLTIGGKFIGTCLDGKSVFNLLKDELSVGEYDEGNILWKITKRYDISSLESDESCLGLAVDVYMDSIGKTFTEYLVNFDYLALLCEQFNLKLVKLTDFDELHAELEGKKIKYGDASKMNIKLKKYSFLNKCFVIEKL